MNNLFETLKISFLGTQKNTQDLTNTSAENTDVNLTDLDSTNAYDFISGMTNDDSSMTNSDAYESTLKNQTQITQEYRRIAKVPEVSNAINEITTEAVSEPTSNKVFTLDFDEGISDSLKNIISKEGQNISTILNLRYNIELMFRQYYVDGRIAINLVYDNNKLRDGIKKANILSPFGLIYNTKDRLWSYDIAKNNYNVMSPMDMSGSTDNKFKPEEVSYVDSGIYENGIVLSHLNDIIKTANQMTSLEDMLIPLRFSRSISRRVFNIDVGGIAYSKGMQVVKKIKDAFKYKKYYNVEKGTISNSSVTASIVEDYFLPKRSDGKGSSIDILEETGNLGETGDIEYFRKKLFQALKVPLNRMNSGSDGGVFDFTGTQIEYEEKRFQAYIHKLKMRFNLLILDILKKQMVSKGLMHEFEFNHYAPKIHIRWEKESNYLEREKVEIFKEKLEAYDSASNLIGELFSKEWMLRNILRFTDEEIESMKDSLEKEEQDELKDDVNNATNIPDDLFDEELEDVEDMEDVEDVEDTESAEDVEDVEDTEKDVNVEDTEDVKEDK